MKLISWNVNGLRACVTKGFKERFQELDADIFCIQESKLQEGQIELDFRDINQYWNYAVKRDIQVRRFLQSRSRCLCDMESTSRNMTRRDG